MNYQQLRRAINRSDLEEVKAIIEAGFPVNGVPGHREKSPLYLAIETGKDDISRYLLSVGADPNQKEYFDGNTPLHIVTLFGTLEQAKFLLEKGADPSLRNKQGVTPLEVEGGFIFGDSPHIGEIKAYIRSYTARREEVKGPRCDK